MGRAVIIEEYEKKNMRSDLPEFKTGDVVKVNYKIVEGEKIRIQVFTGIVIAMKGGGLSQTFSVYRQAYGSSMERAFLLHSPRIDSIEVMKKGDVRRSKLYYLRGETGRGVKVKEKLIAEKVEQVVAEPGAVAQDENIKGKKVE